MDPERASAPFPSTAAPATATRWRPPARSSRAATAWWSSPRARACAPARSASRGAASGAWRWKPARPSRPVAVIGTEHVRRGWRIRPRKVRVRVGRPLRFPTGGQLLAGARGRRHRAHLGVREPAVGVARRRRARSRKRRANAEARRRAARPRPAGAPAHRVVRDDAREEARAA